MHQSRCTALPRERGYGIRQRVQTVRGEANMSGECSVYVIGFDLDKPPSKVGIAGNPMRRMASLQTAHFQRLVIAGSWVTPDRETAKDLESAFHRTQAPSRLSGEWFNLTPRQCMAVLKIGLGSMLNIVGGFEPHEVDTLLVESETRY